MTLAEPLFGGSAFFNVQSATKGKGAFGLGGGADKKIIFTVSITNPDAYREEVTGLIKEAQTNLLTLVKQ
ncbi:MAG: hypothetical protein IPP19_03715 [Verrucomicrobia bacterium]|nr:hypothetical protein [Verrucomicrobiota bacterium]